MEKINGWSRKCSLKKTGINLHFVVNDPKQKNIS